MRGVYTPLSAVVLPSCALRDHAVYIHPAGKHAVTVAYESVHTAYIRRAERLARPIEYE